MNAGDAVNGFISLGQFALRQLELYNKGSLSDEELVEAFDRMKLRLNAVNQRWEDAGV